MYCQKEQNYFKMGRTEVICEPMFVDKRDTFFGRVTDKMNGGVICPNFKISFGHEMY
mgnify:CR=1 FL=1